MHRGGGVGTIEIADMSVDETANPMFLAQLLKAFQVFAYSSHAFPVRLVRLPSPITRFDIGNAQCATRRKNGFDFFVCGIGVISAELRPFLSEQWFCRMDEMRDLALD